MSARSGDYATPLYLVNTVVTEVEDMETCFVDRVQGLARDLVPFCTHAYERFVAAVSDSYLGPPYYCPVVRQLLVGYPVAVAVATVVADVAELYLLVEVAVNLEVHLLHLVDHHHYLTLYSFAI